MCDEHLIALVNYITDNARDANTITVHDVLDAAHELKRQRAHLAVAEFVRLSNSKLTKDSCLEPTEPKRSWVNDFCLRNGLKLAPRTEIEKFRLTAGCSTELRRFLKSIEAVLTIFGSITYGLSFYHRIRRISCKTLNVLVASSVKSHFKKDISHLTSKSNTITADTLLVNAVRAVIDASS